MLTLTGRHLAAFTAALILSAGIATTASARRLFLSNTGIRAVWRALTFISATEGAAEIICPLTLEGSLHSRTISKVSGQLIGYITRAIFGAQTTPPCTFTNGAERIVILQETLPWHVRYNSFEGPLPRITRVRLQLLGFSFLTLALGVSCLYKSTPEFPQFVIAEFNATTGVSTGAREEETSFIRRFSGGLLCPLEGRIKGTSDPITLLGTTAVITIRLVQ